MRACHRWLIDDPLDRTTHDWWQYSKPSIKGRNVMRKEITRAFNRLALSESGCLTARSSSFIVS